MRLLRIAVPEQKREAIDGALRDRGLGYTVTAGAGEQADRVVFSIVVPADAVEHVLDDLAGVGFDRTAHTVSIEAEFATFEGIDEVQERWERTPNRLAPAALRSKAKDMRRNTRSYLWLMVLSAVVATAGLLLGSPAVVVGSMVIAPIVSPALTASVGLVRNDRDMSVGSVHEQALGLGVAVATATAFGLVVRQFGLAPASLDVEQLELVSLRISPTMLSAVVGVAAGAAGAYGLATKGQVAIVGVMIAAALIPTAAAAGIGLAWGNPVVAIGSVVLLVLSLLGINVGGTSMLLYLDYRPDSVDESLFAVDDLRRVLVVAVTLVAAATAITAVGVATYQQTAYERAVNDAVTEVVTRDTYEGVAVRSVSMEYVAPTLSERTELTVTLTRTTAGDVPELPDAIANQIAERTGREVVVNVRYVDLVRSDPAGGGSRPRVAPDLSA